jgi:hypothetical protein
VDKAHNNEILSRNKMSLKCYPLWDYEKNGSLWPIHNESRKVHLLAAPYLSTCNNWRTNEVIFVKFGIRDF